MRIFKSSLAKKLLGIIAIMGCSSIFLNGYVGISEAQAQNTNAASYTFPNASGKGASASSIGTNDYSTLSSSASDTMGLWQIMDMVLKLIYLLLWPLLVLAGLALDNTLVYASIFHLDAPLWKFWNMMKNFANFTLGFMVLFAIIKNLFMPKDEKGPIDIIKKTLIAGILIQASWFLMAAVIDVSTIATYAVGGLPLSVLKDTPIGTQKILSVNSSIDFNKFDVLSKKGEGFKIWYSTTYKTGTINMSPCRIEKSFVVGRQLGDKQYKNTKKIAEGDKKYQGYEVCVLNSNKLVMRKEDEFMTNIENVAGTSGGRTTPQSYNTVITSLLLMTGWNNLPRVTGSLVNLNATGQNGMKLGSGFFGETTSMTIANLIKKSKGFVGPLVTIYSSLLNFAQLTDTNVTSNGETSGIFIIKSLVAIALFFPLLALALVLIARIGVLRLYIVASPFLILKASFKDFIKIDKLDEYLKRENIMGIIFAPVITVAALSLSLIFMTALVNGFTSSSSKDQIQQTMGIQTIKPIDVDETKYDAVRLQNITQVQFTKLPWGEAADWFSWLMINLFAIGLMWMVVFAAIKANVLGKGIGERVQNIGEKVFRTLPILPIGKDGERVGIGSAATVLSGAPQAWATQRNADQERLASEYVFGKDAGTTGTTFTSDQATKIATSLSTENELGTTIGSAMGTAAPTDFTAYNTPENISLIYDAIQKIYKNDADISKAATKAEGMFGADWYKAETALRAAKKIKNEIIEKKMDIEKINEAINKPDANKKILDEYFANTTETTYTQTIGEKMLTITKSTSPSTEYVGELK